MHAKFEIYSKNIFHSNFGAVKIKQLRLSQIKYANKLKPLKFYHINFSLKFNCLASC